MEPVGPFALLIRVRTTQSASPSHSCESLIVKRSLSSSELPSCPLAEPGGRNQRQDTAIVDAAPVARPLLRNPLPAQADQDLAELPSRIANALPSNEVLLAMMSELSANSTTPEMRPQKNQATTPNDPSSEINPQGSSGLPDWPDHLLKSQGGTYCLFIDSTSARIADIEAVLREQSCIKEFYFQINPYEGQSIPGLREVCAGLRHNRGLEVVTVRKSWGLEQPENPAAIYELCTAVHDHVTLKELKIDWEIQIHGDALNKELTHPRTKLTELFVTLPASQQQLDAYAAALENNCTLTSLTLNLTAHSAPNHDRLATALANHRSLRELKLDFGDAASDGCALLRGAAALQSLRILIAFNLSDLQASGLRQFLSNSQSVQHVSLPEMALSRDGGAQVIAGFNNNLSIVDAKFWLDNRSDIPGAVDSEIAKGILQAIHCAKRRKKLLSESARVGLGISAGMTKLGANATYSEAALSVDVGTLIAEAIAIHLDPDGATHIYQTLSL